MTQRFTSELFFMSLVTLLLVLLVLLVLCWILRRSRSRNLTKLKISAGQPTRVLTIRTEPGHANQLLDRLLDRVFLQVEPVPESGDELGQEPRAEPREKLGGESRSHSGSDPEASTAASPPSRALKSFHGKVWKWISNASHPPATPPPPSATPPLANQDQTDDLDSQQPDATQDASCSSQGASGSYHWEEEEETSHNREK